MDRSSFVGRRPEVDRARRLLEGSRLVTLVGPGGVGKTRLVIRVARAVERSFPAGTVFAELSTVREPALVASQVAQALDVQDLSGGWLVGRLADVIADGQLLLVLDSCEHLLDATGVLVDALLRSCPRLRVLATSRHPLGLDGEAVLAVPPLPTPPADAGPDAFSYDAMRLLVDRAQAAVPGIEFGARDAGPLAELCRRLDGIPLAIELAAVRLRTLSPQDVVARLEDRFALLARSGPAVPERHRSLRATMEWSQELLSEPERLLWQRAAVFAGTFDVAAAEAVCADSPLPAGQILDAFTGLVDASLLDVVRHGSAPRFRMLDTVRSFGLDLLARAGGTDKARGRHLDWCAREAASASEQFITPAQVQAFDRLDAVHAELSAAINHCLHTPGLLETGLRIACDLWLYWEARGHLTEGRRLLEALLDACPPQSTERARGVTVAGFLALGATDPDTAEPLLQEGRALGLAGDQQFTVAMATQYLGQAALFHRDLARADGLLRHAADLHRSLDPRYAAFCMADVGITALLGGALDAAEAAFHDSLRLNAGGDPWTRSHALWGLSLIRLLADDPAEATGIARQALQLMRAIDDRSGVARCVEALAWTAAANGDLDRAARLTGAADAVWTSIPAEPPAPMLAFRDRYTAPVRATIGERAWNTLHQDGNRCDRAAAVALALGEPSITPSRPAPTDTGALTTRQRQVAALVAQGLTDREIAARLVISTRTAESHVEQILTRLGLRNRAEIAAWAATGSKPRDFAILT